MSPLADLDLLLVLASLAANAVLGGLWLYAKVRRGTPPRRRSLGVLLGMSFALGVPAGAGALFVLNAIVIWSSAPGLAPLAVAGLFGWALAIAVVGEAMPSQHDRLLMGLSIGLLVVITLCLVVADRLLRSPST